MCPFYVLYDLRIVTCHLRSDESRASMLESIKTRLKLDTDANNENIFDKLIENMSSSYSSLIDSM